MQRDNINNSKPNDDMNELDTNMHVSKNQFRLLFVLFSISSNMCVYVVLFSYIMCVCNMLHFFSIILGSSLSFFFVFLNSLLSVYTKCLIKMAWQLTQSIQFRMCVCVCVQKRGSIFIFNMINIYIFVVFIVCSLVLVINI